MGYRSILSDFASDGFHSFFFAVFFVILTAADGFVGLAVFFEAFFVAAVTAFAFTVTVEGDLEVFLENGVQNHDQGSDADNSADDGENGLEGAALLVFHNITSMNPKVGMIDSPAAPFPCRNRNRSTL